GTGRACAVDGNQTVDSSVRDRAGSGVSGRRFAIGQSDRIHGEVVSEGKAANREGDGMSSTPLKPGAYFSSSLPLDQLRLNLPLLQLLSQVGKLCGWFPRHPPFVLWHYRPSFQSRCFAASFLGPLGI